MREWADVYVLDVDDRIALRGKALFFVPRAIGVITDTHNISTSALGSFSSSLKGTTTTNYAGRAAIKKVMDCDPVVYESAVGFINVCNAKFHSMKIAYRFTLGDIVACVFCFRNLFELIQKLNLAKTSKEAAGVISTATGIDADIVDSTFSGFRVIYNHAETIRSFINDQAARQGLAPEALGYGPSFNDLFQSIAKSDKPVSIKKNIKDSYVYRRVDLSAAPLSGHAWSIA